MKRGVAALKKLARFALAGDGQANNKQLTPAMPVMPAYLFNRCKF